MAVRLSGLQREVIALYRQCLRESRKKPVATQAHFKSFTRTEFEKSIALDKKDFSAIEYLLRKGYPKSRFPRIRCGPKRRISPSSHASSSIRRSRKRQVSRKVRLHNQVHEKVFGWESLASDDSIKAVTSMGTDPVLMALPSSLMHTGDGAARAPSRASILKNKNLLRSPAPALWPDYTPPTRAITSTQQPNLPESVKERICDPRISPRRLLKRETPANTVVGSPNVRPLVHGLVSPASRSPSQRRTLKRFARELELHLKAVESLPKKSLIPSPSITTIQTVEALKPYHKQMLSAGLAVTSAEQRKRPSSLTKQNAESQDMLKKRGFHNPILALKTMDGSHKSYDSSYTLSTDHTVLGWTPPHEQPDSKPGPQSTKNLSRVPPDDTLYLRPHVRDSPQTRSALRPAQSSPRSSLPWLQQHSKTMPVPSISMKSPKHPSSPAESVKSPPYAITATQGSLPCIHRQPSHDPTLIPAGIFCNDSLAVGVESPVTTKIANQKLPEINSESRWRDSQPASSVGSNEMCSLCLHRKQPCDMEQSSHSRIFVVCSMCQTRRPSTIPRIEESVVFCPICSTRQPSYATNRKPSTVSVMCSICSIRRSSVVNIDRSKKECPWCLLFQPPPPENGDMLCSTCLALQPSTPAEKEKERPSPTQLREEALHSRPSCKKVKQHIAAPSYGVLNHDVVPEPIKRPTNTQSKAQSLSTNASNPSKKDYLNDKMHSPLPPVPIDIVNNQKERDSDHGFPITLASTSSTLELHRSKPKASTKAVFRGLQVATNAACDEDIDQWVFEVTGKRVRDFLAGLSMLEGIGASALAGVAKRAAKQRREEVRILEEMRRINIEDES